MLRSIFFFFSFIVTISYAQVTPSKLPEVLPPTPEVAAIIRGAELSSNLHTGAANASIPLYTITLKDFGFPIGLNYSSNGLVVNEICSRTGLGWNLNAGGVISRIVQGKPDDFCTFPTPVAASQIQNYTQAAYSYLNQVGDPGEPYDSRPDLYKFSVNGVYGSFIILRDNSVLQFPYSNNKILVLKSGGSIENYVTSIQITDDKGIKYLFDTNIESTYDHNLQYNYLSKKHIKTAWHLNKIILPNQQYIEFYYSPITTYAATSITETIQKDLYSAQQIESYDEYGHVTLYSCPVGQNISSKQTFVRYNSFLLSGIYASDGTSISFNYEDRIDGSGDKRLIGMNVTNTYSSATIKSIIFTYLNNVNSSNYFLKKVSFKALAPSIESHDYQMVYTEDETLPARLTSGQDHLGFYNGKTKGLLPFVPEYAEVFGVYAQGDRNPDGKYAQIGMLDKIIYPTGGYTKFNYEPNLKNYWGDIPNTNLTLAYVEGPGPSTPPSVVYTVDFTAVRNEKRKLHFSSEWRGIPGDPQDASTNKTAFCRFKNLTTGSIHGYETLGYTASSYFEILNAGDNYRIELEVRNLQTTFSKAYIDYDIGVGTYWGEIKEELCGVRVKSLVNYDPVTKKTNSKFYNYNFLTDDTHPSAIQQYDISYVSDATSETFIPGSLNSMLHCQAKVLSSNNNIPSYNSAGAVTYQSVIESDNEGFANGGIAHIFNTEGGVLTGLALVGGQNPDGMINPDNPLNGKEMETIYFDPGKNIIKKVTNAYVSDPGYYKLQMENYIVRKRFELATGPQAPITSNDFRNLDVQEYPIYCSLRHLDHTETKEYFSGGKIVSTVINYKYESVNNINPTTIINTNSKNQVNSQVLTYPNQLTDPMSVLLNQKNIIGIPVKTEVFSNNSFLSSTSINYNDWFNDGTVIKPSTVKNKNGGNSEFELLNFDKYDNRGNIITMSKKDDLKQSFLWNYLKTDPVAYLKNTVEEDGFAYTSFEGDDKGKWIYGGIATGHPNAVTGFNIYSLSNGSVSLNTNFVAHKDYILTVWANSSNFTIGGVSPVMVANGRNGWDLYKATYNDIDPEQSINLYGSASIDELRFYPAKATINTIAYNPGIGITHTNDENNKIITYEYDHFHRLKLLRDKDGNVVKQYEYAYQQPVLPCANGFDADWVGTGTTRCQVNGLYNTFTGYLEQEQKDMNVCSNTYNQIRWNQTGSSSACAPVICKGFGKRLVGGVCETAPKIYTSSVYLGELQWRCVSHYTWSDGYSSSSVTEILGQPCTVVVIPD